MRGGYRGLVRGAAWAATLGCAWACKSSAPASPRGAVRARAAPIEWTGVYDATPATPAVGPTPVSSAPVAGMSPTGAPQGPREALESRDWVLHVGDSFTQAFLEQNLAPRFRAAGARYVVDATTSTSTTTWASNPGLDGWLARRPALVLVTLGANEFDIPSPAMHAHAVETIARKIAASGASCVWITPPMWTKESGILEVIYEHCAPCVYFDSDALLGGLTRAERSPDHIHPNPRGGARWAEAFWAWLVDHRNPERGSWAIAPFERRTD